MSYCHVVQDLEDRKDFVTIYKKPDECSVPFYLCIIQVFYSFGSYMEAFKYINHDDKQTCNMICHLFRREFGKNMSSGQYFYLFQEAAGRQVGVPLQRLLIVFKL